MKIRIASWLDIESKTLRDKGQEGKIPSLEDKAESLMAIIESGPCATAGALRDRIKALFESEVAPIILATGHRAKGLEWTTVIHLDPWRVPAKWALKSGDPGTLIQEHNLKYVIETRAKHTLAYANLEDFDA